MRLLEPVVGALAQATRRPTRGRGAASRRCITPPPSRMCCPVSEVSGPVPYAHTPPSLPPMAGPHCASTGRRPSFTIRHTRPHAQASSHELGAASWAFPGRRPAVAPGPDSSNILYNLEISRLGGFGSTSEPPRLLVKLPKVDGAGPGLLIPHSAARRLSPRELALGWQKRHFMRNADPIENVCHQTGVRMVLSLLASASGVARSTRPVHLQPKIRQVQPQELAHGGCDTVLPRRRFCYVRDRAGNKTTP